ncbi:universal stress protein [Fulvivirga kasyanovii]|uniref:Universal stress protein n=1 Tax=Fulvivirga kasyanovii TaxID=396812 RepID=A0ABW9RMH4_9BACT|nr:universal stress protein [Fulvivirga kasyanovii]MTI24896.1 universal stress protein [Fulvivirga kasyanovii]
MKNILVPVDFSPFSFNAARKAVYIAEKTNATVHLLHVVNAPSDWSNISLQAQQEFPEVEARVAEAEVKIEKLAADALFENCKLKTYVRGGTIYEVIAEFAQTHKMDLITIGAHGSDETKELFVGSTTQRVIRMATCPVLSVKQNSELKSVDRILFLSDFEEDVSNAIDTIVQLAELLQASVDLLYVNTPANFTDTSTAEARMSKYIPKDSKVKFQSFIYNDFDKDKGMLAFMKRSKPDLITMITHARKGKPAYVLSVTDTMVFHADIPVLSMVLRKP